MPRARSITVCLVGYEQYKATLDLSDPSGFWLWVKAKDTSPFVNAFRASASAFHEFLIEERVGKDTRTSNLKAQIVKIEEGAAETRLLIRPHPSYGADIL